MEGPLASRLEVGKSREKEFCAIIQVAKPRLGGMEKEERAGKGNAFKLALTSSFLSTAPAGDRGLQPSSPSLQPRPASSVSLPSGHLGRSSLLS